MAGFRRYQEIKDPLLIYKKLVSKFNHLIHHFLEERITVNKLRTSSRTNISDVTSAIFFPRRLLTTRFTGSPILKQVHLSHQTSMAQIVTDTANHGF